MKINGRSMLQTAGAAILIGLLSGMASALFLVALDLVTHLYRQSPSLIIFLPIAGFAVGGLYHYYGRESERGTNLILDEIHQPQKTLPFRLAPLVFVGTLVTHLFGGSAGREGTAVQMGGAIADGVVQLLRIEKPKRTLLLLAGMAGGFASVFGTPLAGAVFGLEVLGFRGLRGAFGLERAFACALAAFVGHFTVLSCHVHHTHYVVIENAVYSLSGFASAAAAGAAFGMIGWCFSRATHGVSRLMQVIRYAPLRPVLGGSIVATLVITFGLIRFTGLGIPVILESLRSEVPATDFAWKFVVTALTLGSGFKGGEVTPLFFIGSTFGNALAAYLTLPTTVLAALGFVAVFAGAANVPLASTVMAFELFGTEGLAYFAVACFTSYLFSGRHGIYRSQKPSSFLFKLYS
jgi:H+/Cl- antiporter ClcA